MFDIKKMILIYIYMYMYVYHKAQLEKPKPKPKPKPNFTFFPFLDFLFLIFSSLIWSLLGRQVSLVFSPFQALVSSPSPLPPTLLIRILQFWVTASGLLRSKKYLQLSSPSSCFSTSPTDRVRSSSAR